VTFGNYVNFSGRSAAELRRASSCWYCTPGTAGANPVRRGSQGGV